MLEKYLGSPCLEVPSEICDHGFNIKPGREMICISVVLPSSLGSGMGLGQVWVFPVVTVEEMRALRKFAKKHAQ